MFFFSVPVGPINNMKEVFEDPHVIERGIVKRISHPTAGEIDLVGPAPIFSHTPLTVRLPPPLLGEHTIQILGEELGYSQQKIKSLEEKNIIKTIQK